MFGQAVRFVITFVRGANPSLILLLQFVLQCEEGGVKFNAFGPEYHASCTSLEPFDLVGA